MKYKKARIVVMLSLLLGLLGSAMAVKQAWAHGSMEDPVSRVYQCYQENPMNPKSAACKAGVATKGPQAFYDWNGVNLGNAGGQHRAQIPDGKLCSANHAGFEGLDLPRTDWVAKTISPDQNGNYTFVYLGTAPHATLYFDSYITKDSYDPSQPLKWSDLEDKPFCRANPPLANGRYTMTCPLPNKPGKRVIYNIWQRSDSPEAFYACIDVVINTNGAAPTATPAAATPTPAAPTATPAAPTATPMAATPTPAAATATPAAPTATPTRVAPTATAQPSVTRTPGSPTPMTTPTSVPTATKTPAPAPTNTPAPSTTIRNGDFEAGRPAGWAESSSHNYALVMAGKGQNATWGAWLAGANSESSEITQNFIVPATGGYLNYAYRLTSSDSCGYDYGYVKVNNTILKTYNLCKTNVTNGFVATSVSLSAYAGQTVTLRFRATTDTSLISSFYIDNVALSAAALTVDADPHASEGVTAPETKPETTPDEVEAKQQVFLPLVSQ